MSDSARNLGPAVRLDATGRRIPPPPARTFGPADLAPVFAPPAGGSWSDTRHSVGNLTARERRAGTPSTTRQWARLMAAPVGR